MAGMTFKEKLSWLRESRGESQQDFATSIGIHKNQVSRWENPRYRSWPSPEVLTRIAEHFGVPVGWLLDPRTEWPPPLSQSESERELMRLIERIGVEDSIKRLLKISEEPRITVETPPMRETGDPARPRGHRRGGDSA